MHHWDKLSGFRGGKREKKRQDWKMKISCKNSHTGFMGSGFKSLFYGMSLAQDTEQDMADSGTVKRVCRGCMWPQSNDSLVYQFLEKHRFIQRGSLNMNKAKLVIPFNTHITKMPILLGSFGHFCFNEITERPYSMPLSSEIPWAFPLWISLCWGQNLKPVTCGHCIENEKEMLQNGALL